MAHKGLLNDFVIANFSIELSETKSPVKAFRHGEDVFLREL